MGSIRNKITEDHLPHRAENEPPDGTRVPRTPAPGDAKPPLATPNLGRPPSSWRKGRPA